MSAFFAPSARQSDSAPKPDNAVEWRMSILIFLIVVLVVLALAIYLIDLLPIPSSTIKRIIQALCVLVALYVILERTGVLR